MKKIDKAYLGYGAILIWATVGAVIRYLSEVIGPFTSGFYMYTLGGLLTILFNHKNGTKMISIAKLPIPAIICGSLYAVYVILNNYSVAISQTREISISVGVVKALWPLFTLILSVPILKENKKLSIVGLLFSFAGVIVVVMNGSGGQESDTQFFQFYNLLPFLMGFLSAICWAFYSNLIRKHNLDGSFVGYFMIVAGLIMGLLSLFVTEPSNWSFEVVFQIVYRSVLTIFVATHLWNRSITEGDIYKVSIAANYSPLIGVVVTSIMLGVKLQPVVLVGAALLILGNIFNIRINKEKVIPAS
jgi:drug/metabolite transporter (DMT)-like permease